MSTQIPVMLVSESSCPEWLTFVMLAQICRHPAVPCWRSIAMPIELLICYEILRKTENGNHTLKITMLVSVRSPNRSLRSRFVVARLLSCRRVVNVSVCNFRPARLDLPPSCKGRVMGAPPSTRAREDQILTARAQAVRYQQCV